MEALLLFAVFMLLLLLGIPIGTALGVAGVLTLCLFDLGSGLIGPDFVSGMASFPLLAIPFFVLAGVILEQAGLAAKIARLFELLVGRATGGLAIVAVLTCMFWGALSGSGPATTAAVGLILISPMLRHGYDKDFAGATVADAASLSIIIPPSIAFIIYGTITGISVSRLFIAGILPGIFMGTGIIATAWIVSKRRGYRGAEARGSIQEILSALRESFWALLSPVIILGGIYTGIFTPTEAAVVAVFYSLFIAAVVYRTVTLRKLVKMLVDATVTTAVILFIVVFAGIFSLAATRLGLTDSIATWITQVSPNALVIVLLVNVLLLILGMFLDAISISYLLLPILMPVLKQFDMDPLGYGVIFITALAIGQITPPVGVNLFTAANLLDSSVDRLSRRVLPFLVVNVVLLLALSLFPQISLFLPQLIASK